MQSRLPAGGSQLLVVLGYVEFSGAAHLSLTWDAPSPGNASAVSCCCRAGSSRHCAWDRVAIVAVLARLCVSVVMTLLILLPLFCCCRCRRRRASGRSRSACCRRACRCRCLCSSTAWTRLQTAAAAAAMRRCPCRSQRLAGRHLASLTSCMQLSAARLGCQACWGQLSRRRPARVWSTRAARASRCRCWRRRGWLRATCLLPLAARPVRGCGSCWQRLPTLQLRRQRHQQRS